MALVDGDSDISYRAQLSRSFISRPSMQSLQKKKEQAFQLPTPPASNRPSLENPEPEILPTSSVPPTVPSNTVQKSIQDYLESWETDDASEMIKVRPEHFSLRPLWRYNKLILTQIFSDVTFETWADINSQYGECHGIRQVLLTR